MKTKMYVAIATFFIAVIVIAALLFVSFKYADEIFDKLHGYQNMEADGNGWGTDLDRALKNAKAKDHAVLLLFSGTDWCPPCKALHKNVLSGKEFKDYAAENLELVLAAFPHRTPISGEQQEKNNKLARQFGIEGFPTSILLDADGKIINMMVGGAPLDKYMKFLKKNIKKKAVNAIENGKFYKDVDLAKKTEMQCDLAVGGKMNFSLGVFARKNTQWMILENTVESICQMETNRDADLDDGTMEYPQNKLFVTLTGKTAGTGKILFLCGDKYLTLNVTVRQK